jgi:hypothetical protein
MRHNPLLIVALVLGGIGLLTFAGLDSFAPESCTRANAARHQYLIGNAEQAYRAILADEPGSTCARAGMRAIAKHRCEAANRLYKGKATEEAKKAYTALLSLEPTHLPPGGVSVTISSPPPKDAFACGLKGLAAVAATEQAAKAEASAKTATAAAARSVP